MVFLFLRTNPSMFQTFIFFCSHNIVFSLLKQFSLVIKHGKTEVFHFSKLHGVFNPPPPDLTSLEGHILYPKEIWWYLGFIFDRKLNFWKHIDFYTNKAILTIKCLKMFGNSSRGLVLSQKHLLYRTCILPIILYGFPL